MKNLSYSEIKDINGGTTIPGSPNIEFDWNADPTTYVGDEYPTVTNPNDLYNKKDLGRILF